MSKIEIGRWSEQLRRMLGQKGQEEIAGSLSPEISPTFELEGRSGEWNFLKGVRDVAAAAEIAGVALNLSTARLRNPAGSNVIGLVQLAGISVNNISRVSMARGTETTDLALGTVATTVLDQRWQTGAAEQAATLIMSVTNLDAVGPIGRTFLRVETLAARPFNWREEIVLMPGTNLDLSTSVTAARVTAYYKWHERGLPRLEQ